MGFRVQSMGAPQHAKTSASWHQDALRHHLDDQLDGPCLMELARQLMAGDVPGKPILPLEPS